MPILAELRRRGHAVSLRTLASGAPIARAEGIETKAIEASIEALPHDDHRARTRAGGNLRVLRTFAARAPHERLDLEAATAAELPDFLLVDILAWGAFGAAEASGLPWAAFCPFPLPRLGRGRSWALDRIFLRRLNRARAGLGLAALSRAGDVLGAPPLLLYLTAAPFEPPRADLPPNVLAVGPCDWEPPGSLPHELAGVREPLVLVTTSSEFQDDGRLVRCAIEALAEEPVHVVATLPSVAAEMIEGPANATLLRFAPHRPILERAVCAITHGGMGATQKALALGVPVCAVPFGRDQFEVAHRVVDAGAGSSLRARRLSPERLRDKVRAAIGRRPGAERVAAGFARAPGPAAAVGAVAGLLEQSR